MSIASRIDNMYDNVEKAYKSINKLGVDLTDVDKNIENISPLLDDFYDTLPKVTGTGETLTLNNTADAPIKLDLKGNTSQASDPTPDSPVDVNVVSGDNTIKVVGKNLYNKDAEKDNFYYSSTGAISFSSGNYFTTQRIERISDSYAVSMKAQHQGGGIVPYVRFVEYKKDGTFIQRQTTIGSATITLHNDTSYFLLNVDAGPNAYYEELQIEMGETASTYQEYQAPQTQLISLGDIELCKIGDYQDYIYKTDKWYLHKEIGKVVLNGSENWAYQEQYPRFTCYFGDDWDTGGENRRYVIYSNYFHYASSENNDGTGFIYNKSLYVYDYAITSTTNFKTWLSTHNTIVYYVLATPTNTIITDTTLINQLDNLQNLNSYNPTTNIMQENNDKPFIITASALKDLSNL